MSIVFNKADSQYKINSYIHMTDSDFNSDIESCSESYSVNCKMSLKYY